MWSILVLSCLVHLAWALECNPSTGPSGTTACVPIQVYNYQHQWATCLTNSYIKQKSGHRHHCVNPLATYCWYQCMVEVYSRDSGSVTKDCSCTPGRTFTSSLPPACYSPAGDSCDWYRDCLRKKLSCEDASNAYAIRYAENFCRLYDERRALISSDAQKWLDAVRRCLLVNLVPLVRPWVTLSCSQIRQNVLGTHTPCYLKPDQNVTSICRLNCSDYFKIFWAIKGSFVKMDTAWESMKGLWNIEIRCNSSSSLNRQCFQRGAGGIMNFTKISVQKFKQGQDRSTSYLSQSDAGSRFADGVGSSIASILKWNTIVMDWLAYTDSFASHDNLDITIILADRKALGIVSTSTPSVNFNKTIHEFALAIENGKLPLQVDGYNVWVKSLALCPDKYCAQTQTLAVSDKPPKWPNGANMVSCSNVGLFGAIAVLFMYRLT